MTSPLKAKHVLQEVFCRMSISFYDMTLVSNSYPTLAKIMEADHARMHHYVPCEASVATALNSFFNTSVSNSGNTVEADQDNEVNSTVHHLPLSES